MGDLTHLIEHWGYAAIALVVILGNVGVPVPEETALLLAGYLTWTGRLRLLPVLVVGAVSAVVGDNLGYWIARHYGQVVTRQAARLIGSPERVASVQRFVARYGAAGIVVARFVPGARFLAGPVSGLLGVPALTFLAANALGALLYVPAVVGAGYALGYGLADRLAWLEREIGRVELVVGVAAALITAIVLVRRLLRTPPAG